MNTGIFTLTVGIILAVFAAIAVLNYVLLTRKSNMRGRMEEAMFQVYAAAENCKSAVVVFPEDQDIQVYDALVKSGRLRRNPLGSGYMLPDDYEKVWSKIPVDHVHTKFEPDDGVLTKEIDPVSGKLVPVITEKMLLENPGAADEILRKKREEVERMRPQIEEDKKKVVDSMFALKNKEK